MKLQITFANGKIETHIGVEKITRNEDGSIQVEGFHWTFKLNRPNVFPLPNQAVDMKLFF